MTFVGPAPDPGQLRERVTLRKKQSVDDGLGGSEVTFTDIARVAARVFDDKGKERALAGANVPTAEIEMVIRYRNDVDEDDVVVRTTRGRTKTGNIRYIKDFGPQSMYLVLGVQFGTSEQA